MNVRKSIRGTILNSFSKIDKITEATKAGSRIITRITEATKAGSRIGDRKNVVEASGSRKNVVEASGSRISEARGSRKNVAYLIDYQFAILISYS